MENVWSWFAGNQPQCHRVTMPLSGRKITVTRLCGRLSAGVKIRQSVCGLHCCLQRGLQRFFKQFLMVYSRFCSVSFTLRHSLKTVFPRVPCLSVAVYVVKKIVTPKEPLHKHNKVLCNTLNFHPCISPFIPIDFPLLFRYCVTCETYTKYRNQEEM